MLNLQESKKNYYKLVWFDGTELTIPPMSQEMMMKIMHLEDAGDTQEQLDMMTNIVVAMLSRNLEGRAFTESDRKLLTIDIIGAIFTDYFSFMQKCLGE